MGYDRIGSLHSHNDSGHEEQQMSKSEPMIRLPEARVERSLLLPRPNETDPDDNEYVTERGGHSRTPTPTQKTVTPQYKCVP